MKCGKVIHRSKDAAFAALRRLNNLSLKAPYWCAACQGWHLSHGRSEYYYQKRLDQLLNKE